MSTKDRELDNNVYFWQKLDTLILSSQLIIDRPKGTAHHKYANLIYPVDYGYLKDTFSLDTAPIYAYRGTLPTDEADAILVSADILKKDLVAKLMIGCTDEEISTIMKFVNSTEFQKAILIRRGAETPGWAENE